MGWPGKRQKGRSKERIMEGVKQDMREMKLLKEAQKMDQDEENGFAVATPNVKN